MKILVSDVSSREFKGKIYADAEVKIGTLPVLFSTLKTPANPTPSDKYSVTFAVTKQQRDEIVETLAPVAVEIAKEKGLNLELKSAKAIIKGKIKEADEDGTFKLNLDMRMVKSYKDNETGEQVSEVKAIVLKGPEEDGSLKSPYLMSGSEGQAQFTLDVTTFDGINKIPFRLRGVNITKANYWVPKDDAPKSSRPEVSFEGLDSDY